MFFSFGYHIFESAGFWSWFNDALWHFELTFFRFCPNTIFLAKCWNSWLDSIFTKIFAFFLMTVPSPWLNGFSCEFWPVGYIFWVTTFEAVILWMTFDPKFEGGHTSVNSGKPWFSTAITPAYDSMQNRSSRAKAYKRSSWVALKILWKIFSMTTIVLLKGF